MGWDGLGEFRHCSRPQPICGHCTSPQVCCEAFAFSCIYGECLRSPTGLRVVLQPATPVYTYTQKCQHQRETLVIQATYPKSKQLPRQSIIFALLSSRPTQRLKSRIEAHKLPILNQFHAPVQLLHASLEFGTILPMSCVSHIHILNENPRFKEGIDLAAACPSSTGIPYPVPPSSYGSWPCLNSRNLIPHFANHFLPDHIERIISPI